MGGKPYNWWNGFLHPENGPALRSLASVIHLPWYVVSDSKPGGEGLI